MHWSKNPEIRDAVIEKLRTERAKQPPTNLGRHWSSGFKQKVSNGVKRAYEEGRLKPYAHWTGQKMSTETKHRMSQSAKKTVNSGRFQKGHKSKHAGKTRPEISGPNHWNWKGGTTTEVGKRIRNPKWRKIRNEIYARDNWRCGVCGEHCREPIQCHHIIPVSEGGKDTPSNLITLCRKHHLKVERSQLQDFWRSYLTKEIKSSPN
jgi:predicted restriction endonuclease|tara:strand:+ start:7781 stop:8398 length:618 start_codon:yes stop_codon:yes gene_type:complete